jgi:hypothetical protein
MLFRIRLSPYDSWMSIESENVISLYARHAATWVRARRLESTLYEKPWLKRFCAAMPVRGSVLDRGCGAGEPIAQYLSKRGHPTHQSANTNPVESNDNGNENSKSKDANKEKTIDI